ncbi:hypothetical protein CCOS865_01846 [Pseudomonas reidholzensis]|uniref:Uncharacterized protein n=1 Tax=Pseudomonas reidholzensis TaxID=1785162 RepID=A0A383RRC4_9PSED|nr:hypothetical protein CCOS865_01846 [Pseudomonas reidholzensis]
MAKGLTDMILPDDRRMLEAVCAMRRYQEAQASGCAEPELEGLRVLAEFLFQAIADHNLQVLGHPSGPQH